MVFLSLCICRTSVGMYDHRRYGVVVLKWTFPRRWERLSHVMNNRQYNSTSLSKDWSLFTWLPCEPDNVISIWALESALLTPIQSPVLARNLPPSLCSSHSSKWAPHPHQIPPTEKTYSPPSPAHSPHGTSRNTSRNSPSSAARP